MKVVKLRHKILLAVGIVLCSLCVVGESDGGQRLLQGPPKPNETHWDADDRVMGAGLAPIVYCLIPGATVLGYAFVDLVVTAIRLRRSMQGMPIPKAR